MLPHFLIFIESNLPLRCFISLSLRNIYHVNVILCLSETGFGFASAGFYSSLSQGAKQLIRITLKWNTGVMFLLHYLLSF